jgi:hypothetical protein
LKPSSHFMFQSEELKKELREIAEILNQFKSEAVQLRVLDMLTGEVSSQAGRTTRHKRKAVSARHASKEEEAGKVEPKKQTRGWHTFSSFWGRCSQCNCATA